MKKAEIEQQQQEGMQRIRSIESRLQAIQHAEAEKPLDVVIKQIPSQHVLSVRTRIKSGEEAMPLLGQIISALPETSAYGLFFGIWYSGGLYDQEAEIEAGRILKVKTHAPVPLGGDLQLSYQELPAVEAMATFVVKSPAETMHIGYSAIGMWAEVNGYRLIDAPREIALQLPQMADRSDGITEIQYPVEPVRPA